MWYLRYGSSAQIATVGKGIQNDDSMCVSVLLTIAQSIKNCLMNYAVIRCNTDFTKFLKEILLIFTEKEQICTVICKIY
jgi:hypothetical protein